MKSEPSLKWAPEIIRKHKEANMHENTELRRGPKALSFADFCANRLDPLLPRFVVIPAGKSFYHITEQATGRVKGFRREHTEACALARHLEN